MPVGSYPLTGAAASTGVELMAATVLAAAIINKEVPAPPGLVAGIGLPHLNGAGIKLIFGDHHGNPQVGATEAERLITSQVAERSGLRIQVNVPLPSWEIISKHG